MRECGRPRARRAATGRPTWLQTQTIPRQRAAPPNSPAARSTNRHPDRDTAGIPAHPDPSPRRSPGRRPLAITGRTGGRRMSGHRPKPPARIPLQHRRRRRLPHRTMRRHRRRRGIAAPIPRPAPSGQPGANRSRTCWRGCKPDRLEAAADAAAPNSAATGRRARTADRIHSVRPSGTRCPGLERTWRTCEAALRCCRSTDCARPGSK